MLLTMSGNVFGRHVDHFGWAKLYVAGHDIEAPNECTPIGSSTANDFVRRYYARRDERRANYDGAN